MLKEGPTIRGATGVSQVGPLFERQSVRVERRKETGLRFARSSVFDAGVGPSTIPTVLKRLKVSGPTPVMVIIGGADRMSTVIGKEVRALFEKSLAPVLESSRAIVLTGGTDSGVMAIAGQTLSQVTTLVGVSPGGAIAADPDVSIQRDHDLSVLTGGTEWGSETDYMVRLAMALTDGAGCGVVLLVGGGSISVEEINYFVDAGWPILSIAGSGGAADDLIAFSSKMKRTRAQRDAMPKAKGNVAPKVSKFDWSSLSNADLDQVDLLGSPREMRKRFDWYMSQDELLKSAWTYFLAFDRSANSQRSTNKWVRFGLQVGSLIILSIVLIQVQASLPTNGASVPPPWLGGSSVILDLKKFTVPIAVALPIALAVATAFSQSVAADRGWRVMRGAAESLKREIYRYRAWLVDNDGHASSSGTGPRDLKDTIDSALRRSASAGFLQSIDLRSRRGRPQALDEGDDELAPLSVASYTAHRIDGQIAYFQKTGRKLRRQSLLIVIASVLLAAFSGTLAGTYYAAWAVLLVLGVTALTAYLERNRLTDRAGRYATASADLAAIKSGLSVESTGNLSQPKVLISVVARAEAVLQSESLAWEQLVWRDVLESRRQPSDADGTRSAG